MEVGSCFRTQSFSKLERSNSAISDAAELAHDGMGTCMAEDMLYFHSHGSARTLMRCAS